MDEAYKILPKSQHVHWDKFKEVHGEKTTNYVRSILGDQVDKDEFVEIYSKLSSLKKRKGHSEMCWKRQNGRSNYDFLKKFAWIK